MATTKGKGGYGYGYSPWKNPSILNRDVYFTDDPDKPYIIDYGRLANTSGLAVAFGLLGDRWYKNYLKRGREKANKRSETMLAEATGEADPNSAITVDANGISIGATPKAEELAKQYNDIQNGNYIPGEKGDVISISADKADAGNAVSDAATAAAESGGNPYAMGAAMAAQSMEQQKRAKQAALQGANEQAVERREQMGQSSLPQAAPQTSQDIGVLQGYLSNAPANYTTDVDRNAAVAYGLSDYGGPRAAGARMTPAQGQEYYNRLKRLGLIPSFNEPAAEQSPSGTTAGDDYAYDDYQIPSGAEGNYGQRSVQQAQPQAAQQAPTQAERLTDTIPQQVAQAQEAAPPPRMSAGEWSKEKNNRKIERLTEKYSGSPNPASDKRDLEKLTNAVDNGLAKLTMKNGVLNKEAFRLALDNKLKQEGRNGWQRASAWKHIEPYVDTKIQEQSEAKFGEVAKQYTDLLSEGKFAEAQKLHPILYGLDAKSAQQMFSNIQAYYKANGASSARGASGTANTIGGLDMKDFLKHPYVQMAKDEVDSAEKAIENWQKLNPDNPNVPANLTINLAMAKKKWDDVVGGIARADFFTKFGIATAGEDAKEGNGNVKFPEDFDPLNKAKVLAAIEKSDVGRDNLGGFSWDYRNYYKNNGQALTVFNEALSEYVESKNKKRQQEKAKAAAEARKAEESKLIEKQKRKEAADHKAFQKQFAGPI